MDRATRMLEQLTVKPGTRAALDLRRPEVSAQQLEANAAARRLLEEESSLTRAG